jgi:hypothetical protein
MSMRTGLGVELRYLNMRGIPIRPQQDAHSHNTITYDMYASWADTQHESWADLSMHPVENDMAEEGREFYGMGSQMEDRDRNSVPGGVEEQS